MRYQESGFGIQETMRGRFFASLRMTPGKLRPQIEANHIEVGYSNSRTCEIGLETNTGIPYMSIVYLVNECTTAKSPA